MTDILSIGLMFLEGKDANQIAVLIAKINNPPHGKSVTNKSETTVRDTFQMIKEMVEIEKQQPGTIFRVLGPQEQIMFNEFRKISAPQPVKQKKNTKKL